MVVLHLSYEARQQCQQVGDLRGWIDDLAVKDGPDVPQVLVGDVNAYLDYEWPMDALSGTMPDLFTADKLRNPCASQVSYEATTGSRISVIGRKLVRLAIFNRIPPLTSTRRCHTS